ncbi:hypothetical protein [Alicyclobacillus sendaiensis]|uniref:hypothetical protein n=1 Tax=Alicyclobacillus sendaiensis TaxID=192387 RepID=UPI000784131C|nr:hypothetical protein [Alicyclobacillus sendaiensis]
MQAQTRIIRLSTGHHVWTRRVGTSPIRMLLLHGGPGASHEYFEIFESYLVKAGIELYFYDQLRSYFSDQPLCATWRLADSDRGREGKGHDFGSACLP